MNQLVGYSQMNGELARRKCTHHSGGGALRGADTATYQVKLYRYTGTTEHAYVPAYILFYDDITILITVVWLNINHLVTW